MTGIEEDAELSMGNINCVRFWRVRHRGKGAPAGVTSESSSSPSQPQPAVEPCSTGDCCNAAELPIPRPTERSTDDSSAVTANQPVQMSSSDSTDAVPLLEPDQEMPGAPTTEYFDVFFIHRQKDEKKVLKLKEILQKFVTLPDGRRLTFCLEDIHLPYIGNRFEYFEKSLQRSRYKFIYIGDDFSPGVSSDIDEDTFQWQLGQHYALNEMIRKRDSSVVPVTDSPRTNIPTLLDIFRRLDVYRLLRRRSLNQVSDDVGKLVDKDIDRHTVDFIRRMFEPSALPTPHEYNMPQHMKLIQTNYQLLSEKVDQSSGLLSELYSKDVISHREMETIKAGRTFYDCNEELLNVMMRKTDMKFREFVVALRTANMAELADILEINS